MSLSVFDRNVWSNQRVQRRMVLVGFFFRIFEIIIVCSVVDLCDLVHDVEATHSLC